MPSVKTHGISEKSSVPKDLTLTESVRVLKRFRSCTETPKAQSPL
jgi:hypothetical protein